MSEFAKSGDRLPKVELVVDAMGRGTLSVDGVDLTGITMGIDISARAGSLTEVTIHLKPCNLTVTGDGALAFVREHAFIDTWNALEAAQYARDTLEFWEKSPVLQDDPNFATAKAHAEDVLAALGERR